VCIKTETGSLAAEKSRSCVCVFPVIQEVFDKTASAGGLNRGLSWLQGRSAVAGVMLSPFLEVDIVVVYCYLGILVQ